MDEQTKQDKTPVLSETQILEVFEKLQLSSLADRERFLNLEKLGDPASSEGEAGYRIQFGDSTSPIHA